MNENKPITTDLGAVTAYAAAVEKGYTGTQDEFGQLLANFAESAQQVADDREAVKKMKNDVDQAANSFDIHVEEKKTEASESISAAANTAKEESIAAIQEASTSGVKSVLDKTSEGVKALEMSSQTGVSNITAAVEEGKKNFVTDNTLAIPGRAADAKVTGDKIGELKEDIDNLQEFADYGIFPTQQGISKNINVANTAKIVTDSHSGSKIEMLAYCNKSQSGTPTPTNQAVIPFAEKIKISIQSGNLASHYIKLTDKIIASNKDYRSKGVIKILPNVPYLLSMCADKGYSDGLIYIFNSDMSVVTTFNLSYAENYKTCSFVAPENAAYMSYYSAVGRVDYSKPCLTIGYKYTGYIENCVDKEIEVQEVFGKIKEIKDTIESKQGRIVKVKRTHYQKVPIEKVTKSNFSNRFLILGSELDYLPKTESSASNCILSNFFCANKQTIRK